MLVNVYEGVDKVSDSSEVVLAEKLEVDLFEARLLPYGTGRQLVKPVCLLCLCRHATVRLTLSHTLMD